MAKTYVVTARLAVEDIATIAGFLAKHQVVIRKRSEPVVRGVEILAQIIRDQHPGFCFDFQEALEFLNHLGISTVEGNRGAKEIYRTLANIELNAYNQRECEPEPEKNLVSIGSEEIDEAKEKFIFQSTEDRAAAKKRRERELIDQAKAFRKLTGLDVVD